MWSLCSQLSCVPKYPNICFKNTTKVLAHTFTESITQISTQCGVKPDKYRGPCSVTLPYVMHPLLQRLTGLPMNKLH